MTTANARRGRQGAVLAGMTLANAMILVDQTAVPLALADIGQDLGVGTNLVQWVLTGSLLPLSGLLILGGRLGDMLGRRRVFMLGSAMFAGASAVAGLAPVFGVLLAARVAQGAGGALMLPATVAIVSSAFSAKERGRALGTMGGLAAVAGAAGPTIGGTLTSLISWRAVFLVNLPLLLVTIILTRRAVPPDPRSQPAHVDILGAALVCVTLVCLVFGLTQSTTWGFGSPGVWGPVVLAVVAAVWFVRHERRCADPLMDLPLLRRSANYRAAVYSQALGGMAEMGLGLILPLILVLNLQLGPGLAGLAMIPTTLPMIVLAPLAGRWYDRAGGRPPLVAGYAILAASGALLAVGVIQHSYPWLLPGLVVYGVGLSIVLTTNDPVSLDTIPEEEEGQASGVSATAEQGGGAIGIALLYAIFHISYVVNLHRLVAERGLPDLAGEVGQRLKDALIAAEATGLNPSTFPADVQPYLVVTRTASDRGYAVVFVVMGVIALLGLVVCARLVRQPPAGAADDDTASAADAGPTP